MDEQTTPQGDDMATGAVPMPEGDQVAPAPTPAEGEVAPTPEEGEEAPASEEAAA